MNSFKATTKGTPTAMPDPFRSFALELELPLRSNRAKLVALHVLLETGKDPGEQVLDAVCHLIAETLATTESMIEAHDLAHKMAQEART